MASGKVSLEEKLSKAVEFKEAGNYLYKEGNFRKAAAQYHKAIMYLKGIDSDLHGTPAYLQLASVDPNHKQHISKETEEQCIKLNITVYNNLCACLLQQPDSPGERIKNFAEIVLELDQNNEKAWYRRGQACVRIKNYSEAKSSFLKASELSGGKNKEVAKLARDCDQYLQESRAKEKEIYKSMFKT